MRYIFKTLHPTVIFFYMIAVLTFAMVTLNPVYTLLSFIMASVYLITINGVFSYLRIFVTFYLPAVAVITAINVLFNANGSTVIIYFLQSPITVEAVCFGIASGTMLVSILIWMQVFRFLFSNDKLLYLFSSSVPTVGLMLSMILNLIPHLKVKMTRLWHVQKAATVNKKGNVYRSALLFAGIMDLAIEDSIVTADSMKARGYGIAKRTTYLQYHIHLMDGLLLGIIVLMIALNGYFLLQGGEFSYYPHLSQLQINPFSMLAYLLFLSIPLLPDAVEAFQWRS